MSKRFLFCLLACLTLFQSTAAFAAESPVSYMKTELYFGPVDGDDWSDFLADEVTPRFPQGLTWFDVRGQWRDRQGTVRKLGSRMIILIYPRSAPANRAIEEIRTDFKKRFHQQSVLRVTEQVDASF